MPIIHKNDVVLERPVIIVIYGTPGSGKTSVATTAKDVLLIDTDRGYDRAVQRVDTLAVSDWNEIITSVPQMASYKTIIVDTAKACLDDYLSDYVIRANYKLGTNTIKRFGEMAEQFKRFVNDLRKAGSDIIFICHDKEISEGDIIKHAPDCIGQSKDLLLRIADQVGYISVINKKRTISFEPTDRVVGKNVAQIQPTIIPNASSVEFSTFMDNIIHKVKESIQSKSEAQRKANEMIERLRAELDMVDSEETAVALLQECKDLPQVMKVPFFKEIAGTLTSRGFIYDKENSKFVLSSTKKEGDNDGDSKSSDK